ncbi:hypothetical protein [Brachybacterium alimentarium]|uniref:hypothetical protein n=2 Tax=Brachybacterium alimentarium TaxID=47845 RepID=UPI0011C0213D|nr:hypothetical protein [Brachybacterium alimentarium]
MSRTIRNAAIWLATLTVAGFAAVPAWAEPGETDGPVQIGDIKVSIDDSSIDTRAELDAYIESDEAKTITVDRATGEMTSVIAGNEPAISALTSVTNKCTSSSHVCTISGQVPRPNYGFTGVGTKTGAWLGQEAFLTKSRAGKGYYSWNGSTVALPKIGTNSRINLDGPATFVKVTVY